MSANLCLTQSLSGENINRGERNAIMLLMHYCLKNYVSRRRVYCNEREKETAYEKCWSVDTFGHRAATFGDLRQDIKDLAILIGYEVVEEDK
ncbi:hypothetical protein HQ563_05090 [bacterium]|nr:hypothetical protein [bacterium]